MGHLGTWSRLRGSCPVTGLQKGFIQDSLLKNGFTISDMEHLEYLGNMTIRKRAGLLQSNSYSEKDNLLKYLRAWVSILKEEDAKEQPQEKVKILYVAVPVSITEQAKELIQN